MNYYIRIDIKLTWVSESWTSTVPACFNAVDAFNSASSNC